MNEKLLVIDGSSLLSTSFYGTAREFLMAKTPEDREEAAKKLLQTSDGVYTNGVYTFMKTLLNLIKTEVYKYNNKLQEKKLHILLNSSL